MTEQQLQALEQNRFETFLPASKKDSKGRVVGYVVGLNFDGITHFAWVQKAIAKSSCEWQDFGTRQRSKEFKTAEIARAWAYQTAKERLAKIN